MNSFWDDDATGRTADREQQLVDGWLADLDRLIERRLDRRDLDKRLDRIVRRSRWAPRRWLAALMVLLAKFSRPWRKRRRTVARRIHPSGPRRLDRPRDRRDRAPASRRERIRQLDKDSLTARLDRLKPPRIEQLAYDLRRLDRMRRNDLTAQSRVWLAAVLTAYDARLRLACRSLGVTEHLHELEGVDRELERLRIEAILEVRGMRLTSDKIT